VKILFITQILPYPLDSGGKIKTYQTVKALSRKHQVWLVCFAPESLPLLMIEKMRRVCYRVEIITSLYPTAQFKEIKMFIFKSIFSFLPFMVCRYRSREMKNLVEELVRKEKFDAIHIDHLNMAFYLPKKKNCLYILDEHNIESDLNWQIFCREKLNKFKLFSFLEWGKIKIYERRIVPRFDYWLAISNEDKKKLINLGAKEKNTFVAPIAFKPRPLFKFNKDRPLILFVSSLDWWPNKDGFWWFYKNVFPLVKAKIKNINFVVIGKNAALEMRNLMNEDKNLKVIGYVKNLEPYFRKTNVFIVPLRSGSGIRIKILKALSHGLPVVATRKGAEGVVKRNGQGLILTDNPQNFARTIMELINNEKKAQALSREGIDFMKKNYNPQKADNILRKVYH